MTSERAFKEVDVFTTIPFSGNPVAVILDGKGLDDRLMQRIAHWTNLSETVFVTSLGSTASDYAVRIFTPHCELPFAGHPTLGTAHALLEAGRVKAVGGRLQQRSGVGIVTLHVPDDWPSSSLSLTMPQHKLDHAPAADELKRGLATRAPFLKEPARVDVGPVWIIAELPFAHDVERLIPDLPQLTRYSEQAEATGVTVFARQGVMKADMVVRTFAPAAGINEDPICGSGNGAIAAYLQALGTTDAAYVASQGRQVGRDGFVSIRIADGEIHLGGSCVTCVEGSIRI